MQNFRYSDAGLTLTKRYEGLRLHAYQDSGGIWTIGYGHTGPDVHPGSEISQFQAESLLRVDLRRPIDCVNAVVKVPLEQNQFNALVDFCFNAGCGSFMHSTLLLKVNGNDFQAAADQFGRWINVNGQQNRGLQRRRQAESAMFKGVYRADSIA